MRSAVRQSGCGRHGAFRREQKPFQYSFLTLNDVVPSHNALSQLFCNFDSGQFRDMRQQQMVQLSKQLQSMRDGDRRQGVALFVEADRGQHRGQHSGDFCRDCLQKQMQ